jgi:hypothetical protein
LLRYWLSSAKISYAEYIFIKINLLHKPLNSRRLKLGTIETNLAFASYQHPSRDETAETVFVLIAAALVVRHLDKKFNKNHQSRCCFHNSSW